MRRTFVLDKAHAGLRLDEALAQLVPELSRARLQKLVRRGDVTLDGRPLHRSNGRVRAGARVEVELEEGPLPVVHADDQLLVLDKPAGALTHRVPGRDELALADRAEASHGPLPVELGEHRPGVVHRLDRDTSGVLALARTSAALEHLRAQFRARTVDKRYRLLCVGTPPGERWEVERPLGPAEGPGDRERLDPERGGKAASTAFELLARSGDLCLLEARPLTGRRHQIRLHALASDLAVVDDPLYGRERRRSLPAAARVGRCALHAASLTLEHPAGGRHTFEAPLPADLTRALERLGLPSDR